MTPQLKSELMGHLSQFISPDRLSHIDQILLNRTRYLTVVLEDVYQPHNASAVMRSCECFGIQDIHVVEKKNPFKPNKDVTLGSEKWVTLQRYPPTDRDSVKNCIKGLKKNDYKIVIATLRENSIPVQELKIDQKTALCFGTEEEGLSDEFHDLADEAIHIPMQGFTQSFNVSVSVALTLAELSKKLRTSNMDWHLSNAERNELKLEWMIKAVRNGEMIAKKFQE